MVEHIPSSSSKFASSAFRNSLPVYCTASLWWPASSAKRAIVGDEKALHIKCKTEYCTVYTCLSKLEDIRKVGMTIRTSKNIFCVTSHKLCKTL